jgi:hypothetical protein
MMYVVYCKEVFIPMLMPIHIDRRFEKNLSTEDYYYYESG